MNAVYPILLARQNQAAELKKTISKAFIFLIASSIGVFFLGFVAAPMVVIIKQDFLPSVLPFRILIAALPFFYLTSLTMWLLILFESRRALVMIYGGSMIISIIMNFLFVPNFGYVAAALITSFGEAIILLLSSYVVVKEIAKFKNPKA
ncbi:polysaccharide biosynthesis C-terminal domain-containing protein [Candidatus Gottesmanbacteria bacterium]|nr:polysaccharide biosynthesis C-terminal domain-containing protein [Candidatus Gottesmanbacteria bacterium]